MRALLSEGLESFLQRASWRQSGRCLTTLLVVALTGCGTSKIVNPDAVGPKNEKHLVDFYCAPLDDCTQLAEEACGGPYETLTTSRPKSGGTGKEFLVRCSERVTRAVGKGVVGPHGEAALEFVCVETLGECMDAFRRECQGDFDILASNNGDWLVQCLHPPDFVPAPGVLPPPPPPAVPPALDGGASPLRR